MENPTEETNLKDVNELIDFVKKHGMKGLYSEITKRLETWRTVSLDIGVVGGTGAGKSTFINTLRRVKASHPGAAKTNVVEETKKPTPYEHPNNRNVKVWDLPGVGTSTFPKHSYMEQIHFSRYDFFIIICHSRFREEDTWFAEEVRKAKKSFYFIRAKIDDDIRHDYEDYPETHSAEAVKKRIRDDCISQLKKSEFKEPVVFLISKNFMEYDFPALEARLLADRQELKRESFVLTMQSASADVISHKAAQLLRYSWLDAAACVVAGSKPVTKLSIIVNIERLVERLRFYRQVYGLDHEGLQQLSESANVPKEALTNAIEQYFWIDITEDTVINEMSKLNINQDPKETKYLKLLDVPAIGFIFNCASSFGATKQFIRSTITSMDLAAKTILNIALSKASAKQEW